jgi:hypothetical protein
MRTRSEHVVRHMNKKITKINCKEPFISSPIPTLAPEENFNQWKNKATKIISRSVYVLNKQSLTEQSERVEEMTEKMNRDFEDTPGRVLATVLNKSREKVVINKFVEKTNGIITNIFTDPTTVLT